MAVNGQGSTQRSVDIGMFPLRLEQFAESFEVGDDCIFASPLARVVETDQQLRSRSDTGREFGAGNACTGKKGRCIKIGWHEDSGHEC